MGIEFPVSAACDKCPSRTTFRVVIDKLKPMFEGHLKMTEGWAATTLSESGELFVTCPKCNPVLVSVMPPPVQDEDIEVVGDPATDPTMLASELRSRK